MHMELQFFAWTKPKI